MQFLINGMKKNLEIKTLIVAGWTARDQAAVQHHIDELAELGVAPPSTVPLFYQVSSQMLTTSESIQVLSAGTSGEVEPVVVRQGGDYFFGIASDHTDRELEAFSVAHSKQVCSKPISDELWSWGDIVDHLEQIQLASWLDEGEGWVLYQEGTLAAIRPLTELIDKAQLPDNSAMLCGTFGAIGGVRRTPKFKMQAYDPVLDRTLTLCYQADELSVVS